MYNKRKVKKMSIIYRKNNTDSFYKVIYEDTEEFKRGVYLHEITENKKTGKTSTKITIISTLIYIDEKIKSENAIYYRVNFYDNNHKIIKYIKAGDILSDSFRESEDLLYLLNNGLIVYYKCKPLVIDFLKCLIEDLEAKTGTDKTGWNSNNEYISNGFNTSDIVFTGSTTVKFEVKGCKETYITKLQDIFKENPLVFSIVSYCASGFLLHFLRNEVNQILAITGNSSKGKSTVGKLALSLFTNPRFFRGMDATKYGMSLLAKNHKDNFIFFDENQESNLTQEQRLQFIYSLANASERLRANKFGDTYSVKEQEIQPKYSILIAGEKSFLNGIKKAGTGLDARFCEIVLPEKIKLWDSIETSEKAEALNQFIFDNFGHLTEQFIHYIKNSNEKIKQEYEVLLKEIRLQLPDSSAIVQRKARILAYTSITSKIIADILYEDSSDIVEDAYNVFKVALFQNEEEATLNIFKEKLSHIEQTEFNYFEITNTTNTENNNEKKYIKDYFGFIRVGHSSKQIGIINTRYNDFCLKHGFDSKLFLIWCKDNKLLKTEKNENTKNIMINRQRARYYYLDIPNDFFNNEKEEKEETKIIDWEDI